jgi:MFS family permease
MIQTSSVDRSWQRNFRLFLIGTFLISAGFAISSQTSVMYFFENHSNEPIEILGMITFVAMIIGAIVACVAADMFDHKNTVVAVVSIMCVSTIVLTVMSVIDTGNAVGGMFYTMIVVNSIAKAFVLPIISAMIPNLVPTNKLSQAFGVSIIVTLLGSLSMMIFMSVLEVYGFFIAVMLYLCTLIIFYQIHFPERLTNWSKSIQFTYLFQGFGFVLKHKLILSTIVLEFFVVLLYGVCFGWVSYMFTKQVHDSVDMLFYTNLSSMKLVALFVGIVLQSRKILNLGRTMMISAFVFGLAVICLRFSPWNQIMVVLIGLIVSAYTLIVVMSSTIRQLLSPDELRGRITAISMIFMTLMTQSNVISEYIITSWVRDLNPYALIVIGGLLCVMVSVLVIAAVPQLVKFDAIDHTTS